ncbi:MAG: CRISPR-associated endonuclease Cas2 [Gemmatimonadota bacterium]
MFECNMSWEQWTPLKARLLEAFEAEEDSLRLYFLGKKWRRRVEHYGVNTAVDMEGPLIV